jgi:tetratricopeptide (TPR) repeat protein
MRFHFANRTQQLAQLHTYLTNTAEHAPRICLLSAASGLGKSRLVDEALERARQARIGLRVAIKLFDYRCGESGFFLRAVALAAARSARQCGWATTLQAYATERGGLTALGTLIGAAIAKLEQAKSGDTIAADRVSTSVEADGRALKELLGEPSVASSRLAFDYLRFCLSDAPLAIALENAQLLDLESAHFLDRLLQECSSLRLVLEHTPNDPALATSIYLSPEKLRDLAEGMGVGVTEIPIGPISFDELAPSNFQNADPQFLGVLRSEYARSAANIRNLERLSDLAEDAGAASGAAGIEDSLRALSSEQRVVLWILALSRRGVDPYELTAITAFLPAALRPAAPVDVATSLSPFIELRRGAYAADHDSLLPALEAVAELRRERLLAATALRTYFEGFLSREDFSIHSEFDVLFALLWLSQSLRASDLVDLVVGRLSKRARAAGRPLGLLRLVHDFCLSAGRDALQETAAAKLIRLVYDACWVEGAIDLTEAYRKTDVGIQLAHCQALALTQQFDEARTQAIQLGEALGAAAISPELRRRCELFVQLTTIFVHRVAGDYDDARRLYQTLRDRKEYAPAERCLLNRFAEIADSPNAIERLETAVEIARNLDDTAHLVRSANALAMMCTERGLLDRATALLDELTARAPSYVDAYTLANNRLIIALFKGADISGAYATAEDALALVIESMDRVLMLNNLLAAAATTGNWLGAARFQSQLEDLLSKISEPNMRRISFFNLSKSHTLQGLRGPANAYLAKAFERDLTFDAKYWQARRAGSIDRGIDFRLSHDFDLPVMSNWYFGWPDFSVKL